MNIRPNEAYEPHRLRQNAESEAAARQCRHRWATAEDGRAEECPDCGTRRPIPKHRGGKQ